MPPPGGEKWKYSSSRYGREYSGLIDILGGAEPVSHWMPTRDVKSGAFPSREHAVRPDPLSGARHHEDARAAEAELHVEPPAEPGACGQIQSRGTDASN